MWCNPQKHERGCHHLAPNTREGTKQGEPGVTGKAWYVSPAAGQAEGIETDRDEGLQALVLTCCSFRSLLLTCCMKPALTPGMGRLEGEMGRWSSGEPVFIRLSVRE